MSAILEAARGYLDEGYHLFPASPRDKVPLVKWSTESTVDLAVVSEWIKRWPSMMLCASCGPSNIVVLDIDVKSEPRGDCWFMEQIRDRGPIPWTRQSITGSCGMHFTFRPPVGVEIRNSQKKIHQNADVRGVGGMVVLAPSVSAAGEYQQIGDGAPLATLSGWLLDLIVASQTPPAPTSPPARGRYGSDVEHRIDRALAYLDAMPASISGSRGHDAAFRAAVALVKGFELPPSVALDCLHAFNRRCDPPWSAAALTHKIQQAQTAKTPAGYLIEGRA